MIDGVTRKEVDIDIVEFGCTYVACLAVSSFLDYHHHVVEPIKHTTHTKHEPVQIPTTIGIDELIHHGNVPQRLTYCPSHEGISRQLALDVRNPTMLV